MHMGDKEFLNGPHLQIRLHKLMLRSFSSVEYPSATPYDSVCAPTRLRSIFDCLRGSEGKQDEHGSIQSECYRGYVPCSAGLSSGGAEECELDLIDHLQFEFLGKGAGRRDGDGSTGDASDESRDEAHTLSPRAGVVTLRFRGMKRSRKRKMHFNLRPSPLLLPRLLAFTAQYDGRRSSPIRFVPNPVHFPRCECSPHFDGPRTGQRIQRRPLVRAP